MKHLYWHYLVLVILALPAQHLFADPGDSTLTRKRWLPHFVPVQFAGNIGYLSVGIGYTSNRQNYQLSILYGYVPSAAGGSEIHTVTAKNFFPLSQYALKNGQTLIPYLGLGLTAEVSGHAFFILPKHFPDGYYDFPKNLHILAYGGARVQHLFENSELHLHGVEFYVEAGTIDAWLWYKSMTSEIKFHQIVTLALGVNLLLRN